MITPKLLPEEPITRTSRHQTTKTKIFLVDDHPIMRQGLADLINQEKDLFVCGVAEDFQSGLSRINAEKPDLVVLDISLKGSNGIEFLKNLKVHHPKMRVLMLSMHDEALYAVRALKAGASGYIMKQETTDKILAAIRHVLKGEIYLSEKMGRKMMYQLVGGRADRTGSPMEDLSDRELEVFALIGQGHGTRQIAEELHLSIKTIESHRAHIKEKLNLKNATELVQHAIQWREG
jgi:DNA-binding NarL/FixJ family response regulator